MQTDTIQLNKKQKLFADAIIKGKNQREAYLLAGYTGKNVNTQYVGSSQLINNSKVAEYLRLQREKLEIRVQNKYDLTQDHIVKGYNTILDNLQLIIDNEETDKRTKVAALKAQKDTKDSLARIAGLFNDKIHVTKDIEDVSKEDSITLARISKGELVTSQKSIN